MQAASDIFLGWERVPSGIDGKSHDLYIRQLWDWKVSADPEVMIPSELTIYGRICGWTLARAHARSGDRIARAGGGFSRWGENVAAGYGSASSVIDAWMGSSGHRANILNPGFTHVGVAVAYSASGTPYWTMVLGG